LFCFVYLFETIQWVIDTAAEDERRRQRRAQVDASRDELANDLRELRASQQQTAAEAGDGSSENSSEAEVGG
jgi:hypothetical protein